MKSLKQFVSATIFAALACAGLHAQTVDMRATIPFDFHAGDKLMPAGEYAIHEQGDMVIVRSTNGGEPALISLTYGTTAGGRPGPARLDFDSYGSEYFLAEIWRPYNPEARALPKTAREKELARRLNVPVKATITVASTK